MPAIVIAGLEPAIHLQDWKTISPQAERVTERCAPSVPTPPCPLDGIRVLDLSRLVAGNMLSLQLADFGAEVIKIEDPRKGDPLRDWRTNNISVHWKVYARNKKSVTLNLRDAGRHGRCCASSSRPRTCSSRTSAPARWRRWASARTCCTRSIRSSSSCASPAGARTGRIATSRASAVWSKACRASRRRTASPTARRCCRRSRSPT